MDLQQNKNESLKLARLIPTTEYNKAIRLKKLPKKLMPKNLAHLIKILTAPEGGDHQIDKF